MEKFKQDINSFLVDAFNSLLQIEEEFLSKGPFKNITVKEMHLIDTVVNLKENNIAKRIAQELNITQSSLTTAVSTLEKKGMLFRKSDEKDKRIVKIYPTDLAMQVYEHHRTFHKDLVVCDIVYNPIETKLLREAKEAGCKCVGGKGMLLWQGVSAFKLFTGQDMPVQEVKERFFQEA